MASSSGINSARQLLCRLRGGDYAHAGDKEAIDLVIEKIKAISPDIIKGNCLDFGCGFGGTANEFSRAGFTHLWGFDIDEPSIAYAAAHYPEISFVSKIHFESNFFSLIYLFNVFYAIEDKETLLKNFAATAKSESILAIFDYSSKTGSMELKDLSGKPMYPMCFNRLKEQLPKLGWEPIETIDLTKEYIGWYKSLLEKLSKAEASLSKEFSAVDIDKVKTTFKTMTTWLENGTLGGALVLAKKK